MFYFDRVYGSFEIKNKVILDLLNSKPVQRLKCISQTGLSFLTKDYGDVTRYEHCLGVMILLSKLGASVEEQIAGLLHDVSHTAFSHVVDHMMKNKEADNYHENFHKQVILRSEIPQILKQHGIDVNNILSEKFTLLEKELPDLCADRIDYTYRDSIANNIIQMEAALKGISSLRVDNGSIFFSDMETARKFGYLYIKCNKNLWANNRVLYFAELVGDAVDIALKKKLLKKEDMYLNDVEVLAKLRETQNHDIMQKLNLVSSGINVVVDEKNFEKQLKAKVRVVDPKVLVDGEIVGLSSVDGGYKIDMDNSRQFLENGAFVRLA